MGLKAPVPKEKRSVKISDASWYPHAADLKEAFHEDIKTQIKEVGVGLEDICKTLKIASLDDFGKRINNITGKVTSICGEVFGLLQVTFMHSWVISC